MQGTPHMPLSARSHASWLTRALIGDSVARMQQAAEHSPSIGGGSQSSAPGVELALNEFVLIPVENDPQRAGPVLRAAGERGAVHASHVLDHLDQHLFVKR